MKVKGAKPEVKQRFTIHMLVGLPLCGKSTWCRENAGPDDVILSLDTIRLRLAKEQHGIDNDYDTAHNAVNEKEVSRVFSAEFDEALAAKKNIVIDNMNLTSKRRRKTLARVSREYQKIAVIFDWSDMNLLFERNKQRAIAENKHIPEHVLVKLQDDFAPIHESEGFNKVTYYKPKK